MTKPIDLDGDFMPGSSPTCTFCAHLFTELDNPPDVHTGTCKAFPDGIPPKIWLGEDPHTKSWFGELTFKRIIENPEK